MMRKKPVPFHFQRPENPCPTYSSDKTNTTIRRYDQVSTCATDMAPIDSIIFVVPLETMIFAFLLLVAISQSVHETNDEEDKKKLLQRAYIRVLEKEMNHDKYSYRLQRVTFCLLYEMGKETERREREGERKKMSWK